MNKVAVTKIEVYDDGEQIVVKNEVRGNSRAAVAGMINALAAMMARSMKSGVTPEEAAEGAKGTLLQLMKERLEAAQRQGGPV